MKKNSLSLILPVMFGFLAMGFIDMIGLVTNNVRADFNMSDGLVKTISLSCYLWFLLLSIPVGMALTKWGRKKMVLLAVFGKVGLVPALVAVCIFGIGYANLFGIVFSFAMRSKPDKTNEVSALLIVGLIGGAILPPVLGWLRDISGSQIAAVLAIAVVWLYMLWLNRRIRRII